MNENNAETPVTDKKGSIFLKLFFITAVFIVVVAVVAGIWIKFNLYASLFKPTTLNEKDQKVLSAKLAKIEQSGRKEFFSEQMSQKNTKGKLKPEPYSEDPADREIRITEKELNSLISALSELSELPFKISVFNFFLSN